MTFKLEYSNLLLKTFSTELGHRDGNPMADWIPFGFRMPQCLRSEKKLQLKFIFHFLLVKCVFLVLPSIQLYGLVGMKIMKFFTLLLNPVMLPFF